MLRILIFALGGTGLLALQSRLEHLHRGMPAWAMLGLFVLLCAATGMGPFSSDDEENEEAGPIARVLRVIFLCTVGLASLILGGIGWAERHHGEWSTLLMLQIPVGILSLLLGLYFLLRPRR